MTTASDLRQRADLYRRMMKLITDSHAVRTIREAVGELETAAARLDQRRRIRQRAHAIWIERGRPEGCDLDNWLAAERELTQGGSEGGRSQN